MIGSTWADDDNFIDHNEYPPSAIGKHEAADKIVANIIKDLCDRRGLCHEWESIDADIQKEIREVWADIVRAGL